MEKDEFLKLTEKISTGIATAHEIALYNAYYKALEQTASQHELHNAADVEQRLLNNIISEIHQVKPVKKLHRLWYWGSAAAVILIVGALSLLISKPEQQLETQKGRGAYASDVQPGGNKATLTLANGKKISLTDAGNSIIAEQSGVKITKTGNGQLVYTLLGQDGAHNDKLARQFNTIETPTGGQYQINLPDGTSVWLNAASSLKYPVMFDKVRRRVELSGEGYFEVSKDKKRPFIVATAKYEVEVLGTHFNVNSYRDEAISKTTLLEGSVRINATAKKKETPGSGILLLPGQQAVLSGQDNKVLTVDTEEAVAWKNGYFLFDEESLENIMKKIERWYGVEVQYKDKPENIQFVGRVSRSKNISAVLKALEAAGNVRFEIAGKKVYVTKY